LGRQVQCVCEWGAGRGQVKALLESGEIVLRGDLRRRVLAAEIAGLEVVGGALRMRVGEAADGALAAALAGCVTEDGGAAAMVIGVAADERGIDAALVAHGRVRPGCPLWIVHGKGRGAAVGERVVRARLRAAGFMDSKVAAVSDTLTATRFARAKGTGADQEFS
jgi:hypothetical protein